MCTRHISVLLESTPLVKFIPHPGLRWSIFLIFTSEDIDDFTDIKVISYIIAAETSIAGKQQHKQDLKRMYRRGYEFSNSFTTFKLFENVKF